MLLILLLDTAGFHSSTLSLSLLSLSLSVWLSVSFSLGPHKKKSLRGDPRIARERRHTLYKRTRGGLFLRKVDCPALNVRPDVPHERRWRRRRRRLACTCVARREEYRTAARSVPNTRGATPHSRYFPVAKIRGKRRTSESAGRCAAEVGTYARARARRLDIKARRNLEITRIPWTVLNEIPLGCSTGINSIKHFTHGCCM